MNKLKRHWLRVVVHVGALLPLLYLVWDYAGQRFLVDPVRESITRTGRVALFLLLLSLACTPLNLLTGWRRILRARRPLGLYAFFYATGHFLLFAWSDYGLNLRLLWQAVFYQRFVIVGFFAFLILLLLALTSTQGWQKRLGKRWKMLHRLAYVAAGLVIIHFIWLLKDPREPLRYGAVLALLLLLRIPPIQRRIIRLRKSLKQRLG